MCCVRNKMQSHFDLQTKTLTRRHRMFVSQNLNRARLLVQRRVPSVARRRAARAWRSMLSSLSTTTMRLEKRRDDELPGRKNHTYNRNICIFVFKTCEIEVNKHITTAREREREREFPRTYRLAARRCRARRVCCVLTKNEYY